MNVEYHPAVEEELRQIRDYYNRASNGLGHKFIANFHKQVVEIAERPLRWMIVAGDLRRCLMSGFPYVIYFRQAAPDLVRITVVKHYRRHPGLGRERR